jgi:L-malate glycosyltransferase
LNSSRKIKLCFLANAASSHTAKWANHFCLKGYEVHLVSFEDPHGTSPEVLFHKLGSRRNSTLRYFTAARELRHIIRATQPDLVHAHYAAGYGTLGRLARFHPYIVSVWGSDVFEVPARSPLHKVLIRANLAYADHVCSTSHFMAEQARKLYRGPITVTPFGVDCSKFAPSGRDPAQDELVIGTVKSLEEAYGVEYLIKSFAILAAKYRGSRKLRLVIAGDGALRHKLRKLAQDCGIDGMAEFMGQVPHKDVPAVLNRFSIFVAPSVFETFGVAVLEASSCALPVVVSDAEGLSEVVRDGKTALIAPRRDVAATAEAISALIENPRLRRELGDGGRQFVLTNYEWSHTAAEMERVYQSTAEIRGNRDVPLDQTATLQA